MRLVLLAALLVSPALAAQCASWSPFQATGTVPVGLQPPGTLSEISGIVASRCNPGCLWVHDDGGFGESVVALRGDGSLVQQVWLAGVSNRDWEDIALGPGPELGRDYLYVADIGNNGGSSTRFALLRFAEPMLPAQPGPLLTLTPEVFWFHYPSGAPDAETLLIDPVDGAPYVVTKELSGTARVYQYPLPLDSTQDKALVLAATFPYPLALFTGGDVSSDGSTIVLRDYLGAIAFARARGQSFAAAFAGAPCAIATGLRGLAEAIGFDPDGQGLWIVSEGAGAALCQARGTLPPGGPAVRPAWWCFGTGLGGAYGVPGLGPDRAPVLGGPPFTLGAFGGPKGAAAFVLLSVTALPDGVLGLGGGWVHALPDTVVGLVLAGNGTATLPAVALPASPVLYGRQLHGQVLIVDASAPAGVGLSPGLTLQLER